MDAVTERLRVFINLYMSTWVKRKEFWLPVTDGVQRLLELVGMQDRRINMGGLLVAVVDARRRTCQKCWLFQLSEVEVGTGWEARKLWSFRNSVP